MFHKVCPSLWCPDLRFDLVWMCDLNCIIWDSSIFDSAIAWTFDHIQSVSTLYFSTKFVEFKEIFIFVILTTKNHSTDRSQTTTLRTRHSAEIRNAVTTWKAIFAHVFHKAFQIHLIISPHEKPYFISNWKFFFDEELSTSFTPPQWC